MNIPGYAAVISASGGIGTLTLSLKAGDQLPPGVEFAAATGFISGTPTATGTYTFHIIVTDSIGDAVSQTYTLTINSPLAITTTSLNNWTVNVDVYSQAIVTSGGTGPLVYSVQSGDSLPAGLTLNTSTGVISGTPTATGAYTFHIKVTDAAAVAVTQAYTVTIAGRPERDGQLDQQ